MQAALLFRVRRSWNEQKTMQHTAATGAAAPGGGGSGQNDRVHLAVLPGGGGHDDLGHACHLCRDHVHEHGGGIGRRAAGHIDTGLFNGGIFLAQHDAGLVVHHKILVHLLAVEALDVGGSFAQGLKEVGVHARKGFVDLLLRHLQGIDLCAVKFQRVILQGFIAPGAHIGNDAVHHILHVFLRADVPVQDLLGPEFIKIIQLDHFVSSYRRGQFIPLGSYLSLLPRLQ